MYVKDMKIRGGKGDVIVEVVNDRLSVVETIDKELGPTSYPTIDDADVESPAEMNEFCRKLVEFIEPRHDDRGNEEAKVELQLLLTPLIRVAQLDAAAGTGT